MSFKELLIEIGPENLLPEKLLLSLLHMKPNSADEGVALILAEILIPGSQGLSPANGGITPLTFVNNLPEANAKGAQLQASLRAAESDSLITLDWSSIFTKVHEYLNDASKRNSQPSVASITQLFSSLDYKFGLIDIFLSYDWWFDKTLLFMLQSMYTKPGAFDIMNSRNLTLCFEDEVNNEPELLKFVNIAKLEVQVMSKINTQSVQQSASQPEGDRKLETWLSQFFDLHCRSEPHHVIAGALEVTTKNEFIRECIDKLFLLMLDRPFADVNLAQLTRVIHKFQKVDVEFVTTKLIAHYTTEPSAEKLAKIIQIAYTFDLFDNLVSKARDLNYRLYLEFIIEGSNSGYNVKEILEHDTKDPALKSTVYLSLLEVLEARTTQDFEAGQKSSEPKKSRPLSVAVVFNLLDIIKGSQGQVDAERLKNLQLSLLTTYPRLINFGTGHDAAILKNEEAFSNSFPPQVEQEMKTYYSKMYNKEMEIKEIVDMISRMKVSDVPHDQDIFACMIHSLIDEYRFFAEYPLTALASTSLLFGALLQKDLIQGTALTVALNFIWESCNQPQDSHMFKFAVQSLYNFKSRLHEYPMYCKHLLKCQSLSAHAKMYQVVKDASNGIPCIDQSTQQNQSTEVNRTTKTETATHVYHSIAAVHKTLGFAPQEDPDESVSDKLLFFVNNMTADNMHSKLAEVEDLFQERYFSWFASYLVAERAKTEPNNHTLYANLVFALENAIFYEYVLNTTLGEVDKLLRNFKDNASERSHLKNLGAWLGKITLAHDKPLKRDQVALKYLLVEAFDFKTLHIVIPFVCKVIEQASHSEVFRFPNPWIVGLMKVLVELYECADLKLNLKFEIEVLLNAFDKKVKDIESSTLVRTHNPQPEALAALFGYNFEQQGIPELSNLSLEGPDQTLQMQQHLQQQAALMQQQQQSQISHLHQFQPERQIDEHGVQSSAGNQLDASFSNLSGDTIFTQNPNLRRAFQASLARAVRECAIPILSRVSEAVLTTTEALVQKDFATEGDVSKLRRSYQIMAQQLAHSMVVCSGRKILSETIEATMIQLLGNSINPNEMPLSELNLAIQSNVDLCVGIVENLAASNISELIEERMRSHVIVRERHITGKPFIDPSVSDYALHLPPPLGLQTDGLRDSQLNIYTGFGNNAFIIRADQTQGVSQHPQNHNSHASPLNQSLPMDDKVSEQIRSSNQAQETPQATTSMPSEIMKGSITETQVPVPDTQTVNQDDSSADQLFLYITQICDKAIMSLTGMKETSLAELSADHPILLSLTQALSLCQSNAMRHPELLLKVAQYAVNCLFTQSHENPLSNEIYVVMLDKLCEYSPSTAKDVTWWMVHSVDQRKFNMPVIFSLLKVQLVSPLKLDGSIGKLIAESNSPLVVTFASSLLLNIFRTEMNRPIALRSEFASTLQALMEYKPEDTEEHKQALAVRNELFELLSKSSAPTLPVSESTDANGFLQMGYIFVEWVKLLGHSEDVVKLQNSFVDKLLQNGILSQPDKFQVFFKAATEISTTAFATEHEIRSRTQREVLLSVDCYAILIVRILLKFRKEDPADAAEYFKSILAIIVLVLVNEHEESKSTWNERAYFKFFSSLLCSWCDASTLDANATRHLDVSFYSILGDVFDSFQPIILPGFTFAWISLISHRMFLPKLLELPDKVGYGIAVKLLASLLKFQTIYSKDKSVHQDILNVTLKAINRIFTAIAHDNPSFLIECHYQLVTAVPPKHIQVKNVILSAVPKNETFPNPFSLSFEVNNLYKVAKTPLVYHSVLEDLSKVGLKKPVESFLRIPAPALVRSIYGGTKLNNSKDISDYGFEKANFNVRVINALILHVGISAAEDMLPRTSQAFSADSTQCSLLIDLLNQGCTEFRYYVLDAVMNQLRYPNTHSLWFTSFLTHLFLTKDVWVSEEVHQELQELSTRILLERHIVNKPHPWGISYFLTRILGEEKYRFYELPFVRKASPELKVIFDSIAKVVKK